MASNDEKKAMERLVEIQAQFGSYSRQYLKALEGLTGISDDDGAPSDELLEALKERGNE